MTTQERIEEQALADLNDKLRPEHTPRTPEQRRSMWRTFATGLQGMWLWNMLTK